LREKALREWVAADPDRYAQPDRHVGWHVRAGTRRASGQRGLALGR
jgi:hypothetical protein